MRLSKLAKVSFAYLVKLLFEFSTTNKDIIFYLFIVYVRNNLPFEYCYGLSKKLKKFEYKRIQV
jgi:hypothetical protein